jgi:hypothetical protein
MRGFRSSKAFLLAAALVAGCDGGLPSSPATTSGPRFDFADNPSSPSPIIVRRDGLPVRVITTDVARGLLAIHGPVSNLPVCTNASTRDPVDIQVVRTPSDVEGTVLLIRASDTHVSIYAGVDISALFPFDASKFCPFVENTPKLYEGIVQYTVNIGNASTSFRWEGQVTRVSDGAAFHYVEDQNAVFQQGTGVTKTTVSAIRLEEIP